ncbi:hypothetical protein FRC12_004857 [Ceratobasidium sp. 428]|nr:hypothetical protein FRC12_004857 [Ceratobasidium sp. 428]
MDLRNGLLQKVHRAKEPREGEPEAEVEAKELCRRSYCSVPETLPAYRLKSEYPSKIEPQPNVVKRTVGNYGISVEVLDFAASKHVGIGPV